jgi:hypothetical protein
VIDAIPQVLEPPRPNLGPEPWYEPQAFTHVLPWFLVPIVLLLAFPAWRRYRRTPARSGQAHPSPGGLAASPPSPRERLVGLSASIREALTVPFGTAGRAMTTEELAVDRRLEKLLGDQDLQELIRFLDQVDHLKFAPERSNHQQEVLQESLTSWEPRVEMLRDRIRSRPRERTRSGRLLKRTSRAAITR